ncbi:MAG: translation initiation factor IF-3 [Candidatus Sumerlaeia bacterium]|nr:translation initiation factor IF-3 [Candidatus Sumerlaeia bacterium]
MRVRGRPMPPEVVSAHRINDQITAREVLLIDADGQKAGVVPIHLALQRATEAGLDLVEVAPQAQPPVCRITDNSKILYELKRKQKEAKKAQRANEIKEIKMKPRIGPHDYEIKMRHARELLEEGHKIKLTVEIRGNRRVNYEIVNEIYNRMVSEISQVADVDTNTRQVGRSRSVIVSPRPASPSRKSEAAS